MDKIFVNTSSFVSYGGGERFLTVSTATTAHRSAVERVVLEASIVNRSDVWFEEGEFEVWREIRLVVRLI